MLDVGSGAKLKKKKKKKKTDKPNIFESFLGSHGNILHLQILLPN